MTINNPPSQTLLNTFSQVCAVGSCLFFGRTLLEISSCDPIGALFIAICAAPAAARPFRPPENSLSPNSPIVKKWSEFAGSDAGAVAELFLGAIIVYIGAKGCYDAYSGRDKSKICSACVLLLGVGTIQDSYL